MERKENHHRQDVACSRCRERKTKCTRDKPACESCKGDNIECDYSVPEKRVNHTKLLCRNFDRLEDRLNSIEGELSLLTSLLKTESPQCPAPIPANTDNLDDRADLTNFFEVDVEYKGSPKTRRIIRGQDGQGDQYHGPGTLLSLCYELKECIISKENITIFDKRNDTVMTTEGNEEISLASDHSTRNDSYSNFSGKGRYTDLLERICIMASFDSYLEGDEDVSIRLPPRQLLLMALPQFLSQVDYSTDVFVEAHLTATIERTYSSKTTQIDDAWAICFNTIILLVLGSENWSKGNDPLMVSQFAVPFFQSMRGALHQAKFLTTPRLINVQALTLLSIAAERHYSAGTSASIFAQACLLARRTGLHQAQVTSPNISQDEFQERSKTFTSLHLRDKTLSLTMSSICWLPSFDHGTLPHTTPPTFADPNIMKRAQLAEIQEQLYHYLAVEPKQQTPKAMKGIYQSLEKWAEGHELFATPLHSTHEAELRLTFFMTRMLAYSCAHDEKSKSVIIRDARASCYVLLIAYEKHDQSMLTMFQSLGRQSEATTIFDNTRSAAVGSADKPSTAGRLTSLVNNFPVMAFFQLTMHILWNQESQKISSSSSETDADVKLLRDVHSCIVEVNNQTPSPNRASQVERIFGNILELVQLMRNSNLDESRPSSQVSVLDPNIDIEFGHTSMPTALSNTDTSWAFLSFPFSDTLLSLSGPLDDQEGRRKRPRIEDMGFTSTNDSLIPFFPPS